jgi:hypothetical protein
MATQSLMFNSDVTGVCLDGWRSARRGGGEVYTGHRDSDGVATQKLAISTH